MTSFESHLEYIRSTTSLSGHDVKDVKKLEPGDHIYVYIPQKFLKILNVDLNFRKYNPVKPRHHGVVYSVPEDLSSNNDAYERITIVEMNRGGIRKVNLHKFCYDRTEPAKYCVYGVSYLYHSVARSGTCHTDKPLPPKQILERCDVLLEHLSPAHCQDSQVLKYSLLTCNCEDFAVWCTLATVSAMFSCQVVGKLKLGLKALKQTEKVVRGIVHMAKHHQTIKDVVHSVIHSVKHSGTTTSQVAASSATVAGDTVKTVVTSGAKAVSIGITGGAAVGLEMIVDGCRVLRYKNDIEYTKDDLKMDIIKSGSTTAIVLGTTAAITFCVSNPVGWAIGGGIAAGLICTGFWLWYKSKYGKSWKEKMYRQFSDKGEFNKKEDLKNIKKLNKLRRKLNKYIRDYKLHPDRWSKQDIEEMTKHKEWLNGPKLKGWWDPKRVKRWWRKLQDNLSCTRKNQEELIKSYKTKEQKIKVFFLFQSIKEQIVQDIIDIKNGTYDEKNDKNYKKEEREPLAIEYNNSIQD